MITSSYRLPDLARSTAYEEADPAVEIDPDLVYGLLDTGEDDRATRRERSRDVALPRPHS